jgi:hypothetical protein
MARSGNDTQRSPLLSDSVPGPGDATPATDATTREHDHMVSRIQLQIADPDGHLRFVGQPCRLWLCTPTDFF